MTNTEDHNEAQVYEIGYLVLPSVPEEGVQKVVTSITNIIEKAGGKTLDGEEPALEDLAYAMSKVIGARKYVVNQAWIGWMKFEAEPSQVEEIKAGIEKIEEILRHLLIKAPRETTFTFEAARKARAEREAALATAAAEAEEGVSEGEALEEGREEKPASETETVVE